MKRRFAFLLAVLMCCSLLLAALAPAMAAEEWTQKANAAGEPTPEELAQLNESATAAKTAYERAVKTAQAAGLEIDADGYAYLPAELDDKADLMQLQALIGMIKVSKAAWDAAIKQAEALGVEIVYIEDYEPAQARPDEEPAPDEKDKTEQTIIEAVNAARGAYESAVKTAQAAGLEIDSDGYAHLPAELDDQADLMQLQALIESIKASKAAWDEAVKQAEALGVEIVYDENYEPVPARPDGVDAEPEYMNKLSADLIKYMDGKSDDAIIPIAVYLVHPSSAEIEAMVPIAQPDVYSNVTMEEVNAYIAAKRAVAREIYSAITDAFVEDHLDENDTVRYRGRAIPVVNCNVPKSKVLSLAALEEVTNIGYFPVVSLYPMWIRDDSETAKKLTEPLKAYMENLADEEPIPIRVDLHMPSEEIMERIVNMPKPGEDASQEEIDAYNEAYRQTWRKQASLRTDGFVHLYVHETDPVYYIGEDTATVICEIPVARLMSVASDQSVIQIDLAGVNDDPPPCEHDYQAVVTAPTCTEAGYTTYTCSKCGDSFTGNDTAALGHDWGEGVVTTQPTETSTGVRTYTCSRCGEKRTELIPMLTHVHSYTATVTPPTCTEAGYTTHTCACGDSYVDSMVASLGHSFGAWTTTKAATCTINGEQTRTCARCDAKQTREIAALDHEFKAVVTAPT